MLIAIVLMSCALWPLLIVPIVSATAFLLISNNWQSDFFYYLLLLITGLAMPAAGYLAGAILDKVSSYNLDLGTIKLLLTLLVYYLIFNGGGLESLLQAGSAVLNLDSAHIYPYIFKVLGKISFCAICAAISLIGICYVIELPFQILLGRPSQLIMPTLTAARPIFILLTLSISFQLLAALWLNELEPTVLIQLY